MATAFRASRGTTTASLIGDGQREVVYELTVGNTGTEATTYDLHDEFLVAQQVTVGAGVLLLIAGGLLLYMRRRRQDDLVEATE